MSKHARSDVSDGYIFKGAEGRKDVVGPKPEARLKNMRKVQKHCIVCD